MIILGRPPFNPALVSIYQPVPPGEEELTDNDDELLADNDSQILIE